MWVLVVQGVQVHVVVLMVQFQLFQQYLQLVVDLVEEEVFQHLLLIDLVVVQEDQEVEHLLNQE